MAFTATTGSDSQAGGADTYVKARDFADGDVLVTGVYQRSYTDSFGKLCCVFKTNDGKTVGVNHSKKFEEAMVGVAIGTLCQVVKAGEFVIEKGPYKGKVMQLFDVLTDTENSNPTASPVVVSPKHDLAVPEVSHDTLGPDITPKEPEASAALGDRKALMDKFRSAKTGS